MAFDLLVRLVVVADRLLLEVDGAGDVRDAAERQRGAAAGVDERADVTGAEDLLVIDSDVFEERQQIDFLLIASADEIVIGLAGNRQNGGAVHLCVVQAVQQMNRARPGRGQTDAEPAGIFRVAARHERGGLFVSYLDERDTILTRA